MLLCSYMIYGKPTWLMISKDIIYKDRSVPPLFSFSPSSPISPSRINTPLFGISFLARIFHSQRSMSGPPPSLNSLTPRAQSPNALRRCLPTSSSWNELSSGMPASFYRQYHPSQSWFKECDVIRASRRLRHFRPHYPTIFVSKSDLIAVFLTWICIHLH